MHHQGKQGDFISDKGQRTKQDDESNVSLLRLVHFLDATD
jgi:hypothetical protein